MFLLGFQFMVTKITATEREGCGNNSWSNYIYLKRLRASKTEIP
jgi:hypothetical protein